MGEVYAGRYELIDQLGEGATGSVWRVWDRRQRRFVAAKLLRQRDAEALLRFVREQSLRVVNPHVVPPIGWAAEDHDVLLTMDLVNGGTVAQLLHDYGALPVPFAVELIDQLLEALTAVHKSGLVHRDVKPGNLLLEPTGDGSPFLRLGDFGVAVVLGKPRLTQVGMVVGTPGYVAPEMWLGADPEPGQDLFAVGVVARQLLTGQRPPAAGPLPVDTRPLAVPEPLWHWVARLADHRPEQRPPTADAARAALHAAMSAAPPGGDQEQRRIVVPDRLGPLPAGWTPSQATSQPLGAAGTPTQVGGQPTWSMEAPRRPPTAAPPPAAVAISPVQHPAYHAVHAPPVTRPDPGTGRSGLSGRFGPWLVVRLIVALLLVALAVVAFVLA
jgi:serine/threonine protein kinase